MERIVTCIGANSKNILHSYKKIFGKKKTNENLLTKERYKDKT